MTESQARAAVAFEGDVLRYAEVEQVGPHARLLRLGACDFDFDPSEAVREGDAENLAIVREAIGDVFEGSTAQGVRIVLPAHDVLTWTAPFPAEQPVTERNARLTLETTLLAGADAAPTMGLTLQPLYSTGSADWVQVIALPRTVQGRLEGLGRAMPNAGMRVGLSILGGARLAAACGADQGLTVALGRFEARTEYVLIRDGNPILIASGKAESHANSAFALLRLIDQVEASGSEVACAFVYGDQAAPADLDALPGVFSVGFEPLNPLRAVVVDDPDAADAFEVSAYASCVGAAL
jgi:hypothetical protein